MFFFGAIDVTKRKSKLSGISLKRKCCFTDSERQRRISQALQKHFLADGVFGFLPKETSTNMAKIVSLQPAQEDKDFVPQTPENDESYEFKMAGCLSRKEHGLLKTDFCNLESGVQ